MKTTTTKRSISLLGKMGLSLFLLSGINQQAEAGGGICHVGFSVSSDSSGYTHQFTNTSSNQGGSALSYFWDFGDGSSSTLQNPSHSYNSPGYHMVCLTISTQDSSCWNRTCDTVGHYTPDPCANSGLTVSVQTTDASASGVCDASATASVSGGKAPYTYSWYDLSGPLAGNGSTINGLCMTSVCTLVVYDANQCSVQDGFYFTQDSSNTPPPDSLNCLHSTLNVAVNGSINPAGGAICNGIATANVTGGVAPYTYYWVNNGLNTNQITNLCPHSTHWVYVTDSEGCTKWGSVTLAGDSTHTVPDSLNYPYVYVNSSDASGDNVCDGTVDAFVSGGTAPYTYLYSNGATMSSLTGLCPGYYSVVATDAHGKTSTNYFVIGSPSTTYQDSTHNPGYDDSTSVGTVGGNQNVLNCSINYSLIDSIFISGFNFINPDSIAVSWAIYINGNSTIVVDVYAIGPNGVYTVILQLLCNGSGKIAGAATGVKAVDKIYVNKATLGIANASVSTQTNVFPMPFGNTVNVKLGNENTYKVTVFDLRGRVVMNSIELRGNTTHALNVEQLHSGYYLMQLESASGKEVMKLIKE